MKKALIIMLIVCAVVASVATASSATCYIDSQGCSHKNDAYQSYGGYDQAWAKARTDGTTHSVTVGVVKGGQIYGNKTTQVSSTVPVTCYSQKVPGSGGSAAVSYNL